jgi:hypothetical protein
MPGASGHSASEVKARTPLMPPHTTSCGARTEPNTTSPVAKLESSHDHDSYLDEKAVLPSILRANSTIFLVNSGRP